jgi:hypothetical protein
VVEKLSAIHDLIHGNKISDKVPATAKSAA